MDKFQYKHPPYGGHPLYGHRDEWLSLRNAVKALNKPLDNPVGTHNKHPEREEREHSDE